VCSSDLLLAPRRSLADQRIVNVGTAMLSTVVCAETGAKPVAKKQTSVGMQQQRSAIRVQTS